MRLISLIIHTIILLVILGFLVIEHAIYGVLTDHLHFFDFYIKPGYFILIIACVFTFLTIIDYHFTSVVRFFADHRTNKKKEIAWLDSDSEPDFAFKRDPDAKQNIGAKPPPMSIQDQIDEIEENALNGTPIDYERNHIAANEKKE